MNSSHTLCWPQRRLRAKREGLLTSTWAKGNKPSAPSACFSVSLRAAFEKLSVWDEKPNSRGDPDAAVGLSCLIKTQQLTRLIRTAATREGGVNEARLTSEPCVQGSRERSDCYVRSWCTTLLERLRWKTENKQVNQPLKPVLVMIVGMCSS